jgi:hypothetical protein
LAGRLERLFKLRLFLVLLGLALFLGTLAYGSLSTFSVQDAKNITKEVNSTLPHNLTLLPLASAIFQNNFKIALFGFIPFLIGTGILLFIGYSTGSVISAQAIASGTGVTGLEALFVTMLFPFFFWELAGYALTMMEGIIITRGLIKGNRIERFVAPGHFRDGELFKALLILALTAVVLVIAAVMESYLILIA